MNYFKSQFLLNSIALYLKMLTLLEKVLLPILILLMRIWVAKIFWLAGLLKISNWESTISLFEDEYKVPVMPPELAAYFATAFELICPILLVIGLASRIATLPLLAMIAVIQFTYSDMLEHYYCSFLLSLILFYGPGTLSLDHLIKRKWIC
jgi:putative oxidoreductase